MTEETKKPAEAAEEQETPVEEPVMEAEAEPKKKKFTDKLKFGSEKIQAELEAEKAKYAELEDKYKRTLAEYQNFRTRSQREKEGTYSDAVAATIAAFLPVLDNLQRAAAAESKDPDFKKGVEMTLKGYMDLLDKYSVVPTAEVGQEFDANFHNAVMHIEDEELGENLVAEIFQQGYKMGDRVLRHAVVKVAN